MKRIKYLSIVVLFAFSLVSIVPGNIYLPVNAADDNEETTAEVWNGSYDTSWYDAEESELYLFSAEDFAGLSYLVNTGKKNFVGQTIILEADIDLASLLWTPIGEETAFEGVFDGKNHIIRGMKCVGDQYDHREIGLFGIVKGEIRNVILSGCLVEHSAKSYGRFSAGLCKTLSGGVIDNCHVYGRITSETTAGSYEAVSGGIVCELKNGSVSNSSMHGDCSAKAQDNPFAGGICGISSGTCTIDGCYVVFGTISSAVMGYTPWSYAGGLCGKCSGNLTIKNSYNLNKVSASSVYIWSKGSEDRLNNSAGGFVGYVSGTLNIENSFNAGNINATKAPGGILGTVESSAKVVMTNVYYSSATAAKGVWNGTDDGIAKNDANMKKEAFAKALGDAFVYQNDSYPVLAWQIADNTTGTETEISESSVEVGQSIQLTVTNYSGTVTWVSNNTDIITISPNGIATGIKAGEAMIYAILENGKALYATITVFRPDLLLGDCNGNTQIEIADAVLLLRYISEDNILSDDEKHLEVADFNQDGILTLLDVTGLLKHLAELGVHM